jgi:hypothetical protein
MAAQPSKPEGYDDRLLDLDSYNEADAAYDAAMDRWLKEQRANGHLDMDLTSAPEPSPVGVSWPNAPVASVTPEKALEALLAPYSVETENKARQLLQQKKVERFKLEPTDEGQVSMFNVKGSTLYVCKITRGISFLFAECSCPNGIHRGGDAICYHSIAARVMEAGLDEFWVGA